MPSAISSTTGCMGSGLLISGWRSTAPTSVQSRLNDPGNDLIGRGSVAAVHAGPDTAIEGSSRCRERAGELDDRGPNRPRHVEPCLLRCRTGDALTPSEPERVRQLGDELVELALDRLRGFQLPRFDGIGGSLTKRFDPMPVSSTGGAVEQLPCAAEVAPVDHPLRVDALDTIDEVERVALGTRVGDQLGQVAQTLRVGEPYLSSTCSDRPPLAAIGQHRALPVMGLCRHSPLAGGDHIEVGEQASGLASIEVGATLVAGQPAKAGEL